MSGRTSAGGANPGAGAAGAGEASGAERRTVASGGALSHVGGCTAPGRSIVAPTVVAAGGEVVPASGLVEPGARTMGGGSEGSMLTIPRMRVSPPSSTSAGASSTLSSMTSMGVAAMFSSSCTRCSARAKSSALA